MEINNTISTLVILGFQNLHGFRYLLVCLLFLTLCVALCGNLLIIILVAYDKNLKCPMYLFLSQLSICDGLLVVDSVPNTLYVLLREVGTMSLGGCILQYTFFVISECSETLLLTVMSYDRYLAICKPLNYSSIMSGRLCWILSIMSWSTSVVYALILSTSISSLHFCGPSTIDHFFCDLSPLLDLSCSDVSFIEIEAKVLSIPAVAIPFLVIMVSYICIVKAILNISSFSGRKKAFFTCSSHLTVVCLYYGTVMTVYTLPTSLQSVNVNKIFSLIYTSLTPSLNPIVYSLRNNDILGALARFTNKITFCSWGHI